MNLTNAEVADIPVPPGMTVETEKHNSSLKRIIFKRDGKTVLQIEQPATYESLRLLKPEPPKTKEVWTLTMRFKDLVQDTKDFDHEFEANSAARELGPDWEHAIEKRTVEVQND